MSAPPLVLAVGAALAVGAGVGLYAWFRDRSFLTAHPSIDGPRDLDAFKRVVKGDMYLALIFLGACGTAGLLLGFGFVTGRLRWAEIRFLLLLGGPACLAAGAAVAAVERRVKAVPVTNEALRAEFDRVVERWDGSALPDW